MIIITGAATIDPARRDEAERLCLEHSARSRTEPGCLHHEPHWSMQDPNRVVFVEHWADRAAVDAHFAVPASNDFVAAIAALATEAPTIEIHEVPDSAT